MVHRHLQARPATVLKAVAASRDALGVAVACRVTGSWLAALCAQAGRPLVLGPALSMQALHGGQAQKEKSDAHQMAVLRRGGRLPQASGSPAARRATRARRRRPRMRQRAERLTHLHKTPSQDTLPEMGQKRAAKAHQEGGQRAAPLPRCPSAAQAPWHCWAPTPRCGVPGRGPASQRPSTTMPIRSPACGRCPGWAPSCASSSLRKCLTSTACRGARTAWRTAA
jgi:hypothetical protein